MDTAPIDAAASPHLLIAAFLRAPRGPAFALLRDAVLGAPDYRFHDDALRRIEPLADTAAAAFLASLPGCMPGFLLTPRLHALAARCAQATGDAPRARYEALFAQGCIMGLLGAGSGDAAAPYPVTHVEDAHDLLAHLGLTALAWRRAAGGAGIVDIAELADGRRIHFDITSSATPIFGGAAN